MRAVVASLMSCVLVGASSAWAEDTDPALLEAEALLRRLDLTPGQTYYAFEHEGPSGKDVTAAELERALRSVAARCLAGKAKEDCKELDRFGKLEGAVERRRDAVVSLVSALETLGAASSLPLLWQLEARGFYPAENAREDILTRGMTAALGSRACAPPSAEEVAVERAALADFAVLRPREGALVATKPTPGELDDLAYFLASVKEAGAPVGEAGERVGSWKRPAPENKVLDAAAEELGAARRRGDARGMDAAARRYLVLLGYPGPLKASEESRYGWHGSRFSAVMREWAEVREQLGDFAEAAALYRRVSPSDGACGTGGDLTWARQVRGVIRATEQHSGCRGVVVERLLDVDGQLSFSDHPSPYGPARLRDAGFDVARLFRGALVTRQRDLPVEELKRVLSAAPEPLRTAALRRLQQRGPEAWEKRVRALEGLADVAQRDALEPLLAIALDSVGETQHRAVEALGVLAERPAFNPCGDEGGVSGSVSGSWRRSIRKLGDRCATWLPPPERDGVARRLLPLLASPDGRTREATAKALGKVGAPLAVPRLKALAEDGYTQGAYLEDQGRRERPRYVVREAVAEALEHIEELERPATDAPPAEEGPVESE